MKAERWYAALVGAVLAFVISLGAVGCLVTGFGLNLERMTGVMLVCAGFGVISAFLFLWKRGGTVLLCLLALLSGYLWHRGDAGEQILRLIYRISYVYHQAYGWGYLQLVEGTWYEGFADYPVGILGAVIAILVSRAVCRGKRTWPVVLASLVPLLLCLVVTDTVPQVGYLFALMAGLIILILTSGVRRESVAQGNFLTAMVVLPVLIGLLTLFLAIPQEGYVNQSAELREKLLSMVETVPQTLETAVDTLNGSVQSGEPEDLDLRKIGARPRYTSAVMDVMAETGGTLYLRGQDYDAYSGTGWTATEIRIEEFQYDGEPGGTVWVQTRGRQAVYYLPYYPAEDTLLAGGRLNNGSREREYTFTRSVLPENWRERNPSEETGNDSIEFPVAGVEDVEAARERQRFLNLPNDTRTRAQAMLETILSGAEDTTEKADRIGEFVRNSAEYDRNTGRMPGEEPDFALWFLEESDTGYCVHFATAAVVLLRAADIPARYVSGYMVETEAGQTVTVTMDNAHAWAEYYEPKLDAWVILEATPAAVEEEGIPAATEEAASTPTETQPRTEPESTKVTTAVTEIPAETSGATQEKPAKLPGALGAVFLVLGAVLAVLAQRNIRLAVRRRHQRTGKKNAQALARWRETELLCRLLGQPVPEELAELAQKAKFSQHTLTEEELLRFESHNRVARQQLREKPWYLRVVYAYVFAAY